MLTLFSAPPSPYARKVRVTVAEKGLGDIVTIENCLPFDRPAGLIALNPLSKVPSITVAFLTRL